VGNGREDANNAAAPDRKKLLPLVPRYGSFPAGERSVGINRRFQIYETRIRRNDRE